LVLVTGIYDETVEAAVYDARLERIESAVALNPKTAGPRRLAAALESAERESVLSTLFELFLGCIRELHERNPQAFEVLEALALTGDAEPEAAAEPAGDANGGAAPLDEDPLIDIRLRSSDPLFLSLKDAVFFSLTGAHATDPTTASSSSLYDVTTGDWRRGRLKALGIGAARLPVVMRGGGGSLELVSADRLRNLGLPFAKPLKVLNHTNTLSALHTGAGAEESGDLLISLNGRDFVSYLVDAPGGKPCAYLLRFGGTGFHATAAPRGTGEYLRWGSETFSRGTSPGKPSPCEGEVGGEHAGGAVVFRPFAGTEPGGTRDSLPCIILGLTLGTAGSDILRGIVEGAAFDLFHAVLETGGEAAERVFLCTENPAGVGLAAVFAHLLNKDVRLVRGFPRLPLCGCAMNALRAIGAPMPSVRAAENRPSADRDKPPAETTFRPDAKIRDRLLGRLRFVSSLRETMNEPMRRMRRMSGI
jgi:hypothetical protein